MGKPIRPSFTNRLRQLWATFALGFGALAGVIFTPIELAFADTQCERFIRLLPRDVQSDYISVPEDWSNPNSRRIRVFYYFREGHDFVGKKHLPVVFFNGGPGSDSHSGFYSIEEEMNAQILPFVYIDQRGTGCSDPYPSGQDPETAKRVTLYGSRAIVQDAEEIRKSLFGIASKWRAFGQSFGGRIVHRYIQIAPEGLASAHIHGSSLMKDPVEGMTLRLRSQRRVAENYFAAYPTDREILRRARQLVAPDRCYERDGIHACGPALLDGAVLMLGFRTNWRNLHQMLAKLLSDEGNLDSAALKQFVDWLVLDVLAENGFAYSIIHALEISEGRTDPELCRLALERLQEQAETPQSWPLNECRLLMAVHSQWDPLVEQLGVTDPLHLESVKHSLQNAPDLKMYLYSGRQDVFVPMESFAEELNELGARVNYRSFLESGHEGFYTEQAIWADLK